jgi:transcription elongation factor GreA
VQINNAQTKFFIVGEWEANPTQKKISHSSPLGVALLGKKVGDKVEVTAPAGKILYTIVSIE